VSMDILSAILNWLDVCLRKAADNSIKDETTCHS
jgi:hypothetical protein